MDRGLHYGLDRGLGYGLKRECASSEIYCLMFCRRLLQRLCQIGVSSYCTMDPRETDASSVSSEGNSLVFELDEPVCVCVCVCVCLFVVCLFVCVR